MRMGKCGGKGAARNKAKGRGTKGSGQMVSDEVMADEEMACRAKARMGKCGGKGRARNNRVSDEVMADSDEAMACRRKACLNALSGLQDAVYKAINMPTRD